MDLILFFAFNLADFQSNFYIGIASLASATIAFITAIAILQGWFKYKKPHRLMWGAGMFLYSLCHLMFAIMMFTVHWGSLDPSSKTYLILIWVYWNLAGGIALSLMLAGVLFVLTDKPLYKYGAPLVYFLIFIGGTVLFTFIFPPINPYNFITLQPNITATAVTNLSWFSVLLLIPVSVFIAFLYLRHFFGYRALKSSLLISIHFFGYSANLIIWPFESLKFWFYAIRAGLTCLMLIAFLILIFKKPATEESGSRKKAAKAG